MNPLRTLTRTGWAIVAALIAVVLILGMCSYVGMQRRAAQEARGAAGMAEAGREAARDAIGVVERSQARSDETDALTKENRDAILSAPGADQRLDPGLDAAARRAVCLRRSSAHLAECRAVLDTDPR